MPLFAVRTLREKLRFDQRLVQCTFKEFVILQSAVAFLKTYMNFQKKLMNKL